MSRVITDNPGGWSRSLPGHTVEYDTGFALPFYFGGSLVIAAGQAGTYTLTVVDTDHIFFIDVVNVTPQAFKEFSVLVYINDVPYVATAAQGYCIIPLRMNPSIQLIDGDHVDVTVTNLDASQRTFLVKINGTKIIRPTNFGHAPGAYFYSDDILGPAPLTAVCEDQSTYSPTAWEWDFDDGSPHEYTQDVTHVFTIAGTYHIKLKVSNAYGWDTYAYPFVVQ